MRALITQHFAEGGPGALGDFLESQGVRLSIARLDLGQPLSVDGFDIWISLGGIMDVGQEDQHPWMSPEEIELAEWAKSGRPVLGICLGAQLLAAGLGAKVVKSPEPEIGWSRVWLNDIGANDAIFEGVAPGIELVQWHGRMFEVPKGAELLAGSKDCPHQVFAYQRAYGFQPHIEATSVLLDSWYENPEQKTAINAGFQAHGPEMARQTEQIFSNFLALAARAAG